MIGRLNTRVFPEPVNAIPIISRPVSLCSCMDNVDTEAKT